jgi:site-specific DNA recombinase
MNRMLLYIRVSSEGQKDNSSPEEQRRKGHAVADYHELEVAGVYEDLAVSGTTPFTERPGGAKVWAEAREGDVVCVSKLDRMFRSAEDALVTARKLKERGVDLIVADLSVDPITQNGMGKVMFGLMATFAEFERERIAERVRAGQLAKRAKGGYGGGRRPFGYRVSGAGRDAQLEPHPQEQAAITDMKDWHVEGHSTRQIAARVQEKHGFYVSHVTVSKILKENRP